MIKIVLSGLIFPFTMLHFFWRAFERRKDVELFVVGPFFGNQIPWNYGMSLPQKYVKVPNYALPVNFSEFSCPVAMVQKVVPWKPDLWLQVDAGWHMFSKPDAGIVALVETDPHVLKKQYELPALYSDKIFCMQTPYCLPNEIYLPYGYDPEIHFPEKQEKIYDACLIGLHYATRDALVDRLRRRGLNVYYSIGEIYDEYRKRYNQSKIALSWSSMLDLPARNWEALAMGLPLVCNNVPDMARFFTNGEDYLGFDTLEDAEGQVMRLLIDDEFREKIAQTGYQKTTKDSIHTWDARVEQLLLECKLI